MAAVLLLQFTGAALAAPQAGAGPLAPWLDIPAAWSRKVENGVVAVSPNDLPPGATLVLLIEPAQNSNESPAAAYDQALRDLGPWRAAGAPAEQKFDNGWVFRLGVGVATLDGRNYTAQTAVARRGDLRVRFWALADSDDTFNRYRNAIGIAIASAQDITHPPARAAAKPKPAPTTSARADPAFGKGVSGVYVGVERGASAALQMQSSITDYVEVDVFYPDGTYRRRLPVRGLASDRNWERQQQEALWGTWQRQGSKVVVRRGSYTSSYAIEDEHTLVSDRGRPWSKIAPHSGARLDGAYARADYHDASAPRLVLRADGSYEDRGDFLRMVGSAQNLVAPDGDAMLARWSDAEARRALGGGRGTYALDEFTLTLRDRDGRVWQINAYVPPGEAPPRPRRLVINGRVLLRE